MSNLVEGSVAGELARDDVHVPRVSEVRQEVVNRVGAGGNVLDDEAEEGNHGEAAVLDLVELGLGGGHLQGVENAAVVANLMGGELVAEDRVDIDGARVLDVSAAERLDPVEQDELNPQEGGGGGVELKMDQMSYVIQSRWCERELPRWSWRCTSRSEGERRESQRCQAS
jgi:hypothetical protein